MSDGAPDDPNASAPRDHPSVAVVLIPRVGGDTLTRAAQALAAAARSFGIGALVLIPTRPGSESSVGSLPFSLRELPVDPAETEAVWRTRALSETAADIVHFVDDGTAARLAWDDILPFRLGLLRHDLNRPEHLREALERAGVPAPPTASP
jgi:nitroreductase